MHYDELGIIVENDMIIDSKTKISIDELSTSNNSWLKEYMEN